MAEKQRRKEVSREKYLARLASREGEEKEESGATSQARDDVERKAKAS